MTPILLKLKIRTLARSVQATHVVFDILFDAYQPPMQLPLLKRWTKLRTVARRLKSPRLLLSDGLVADGKGS
jgi:hypothetical protein